MKKVAVLLILALTCSLSNAQEQKAKIEKLDNGLTLATFFHSDGSVAQKGTFLNDQRHGEWTSFDRMGNKIAEAEYTNDKKTGKWFFWKGEELTEVDYSNNDVVAVNKWINKSSLVSNKP